MARGLVQRRQLDQAIEPVKDRLGPDVVSLRYSLGADWSGDAAIFFTIVLSDEASQRDRLLRSAKQIESAIDMQIEPFAEWGLLPYFSYRSQSEDSMPEKIRA